MVSEAKLTKHKIIKDMNKNEKFVITINRELGSGGRTVGRKLAEKLNVEFYDKALIEALKEKYNLSVKEIEKLKGQSHTWWAELKRAITFSDAVAVKQPKADSSTKELTGVYIARPDFSTVQAITPKDVFQAETEILKGIGEAESCVIAGRSGFYVFRDHPNHMSILIQATMPFRVERVMRKQNMTEAEARKTIDKIDKMRENYVKEYTGTSRYDTRNYDLVITADGKTEDEIVDLIMAYIG